MKKMEKKQNTNKCPICYGLGFIFEDFTESEGGEVREEICYECNGIGVVDNFA